MLSAALCLCVGAMAQNLGKAVKIKAGSEYIDLSRNAAPVFYDFDKDGLKDLIVGNLRGSFLFYKNIGTKDNPKFGGYSNIIAGGEEIKIPNY